MPRYKDTDVIVGLIKETLEDNVKVVCQPNSPVAEGYLLAKDHVIGLINIVPTADVVLRAELVTQTFKDAMRIASLQRRNGNLTALVKALIISTSTHKEEEAYNKGYEDAKTSILMDIKALMQIIILDYKEVGSFENAEIVGYVQDHLLSELGKRYTEGIKKE